MERGLCRHHPHGFHDLARKRSGPVSQIDLLRSLPLFEGMSDETLRHMAGQFHRCHFQAGEMIFHQGDPGSVCHVILKGSVRVFVTGDDGSELSLRILRWGEILGEMALFEDLPRSASVEALEETYTLELHRDTLISCLRRSPSLALELLRDLSGRLRHATQEASGLASLTVVERLTRRLRQLAEWAGRPVADGTRITLPLTQQELATLIGTSRESVNRALVQLRRQGKVRLEDGWIVLLDQGASDDEVPGPPNHSETPAP